ncbi:MAG TPA: hypothetical protein VJB64_03460 [Patescibacteria group bacterium]|nr:hypothetical protein [Patescibacteria group bacterium]
MQVSYESCAITVCCVDSYWDVPQAIFDLATSICIKNPDCASCPLRQDCKAAKLFLSGRVKIPKRSVAVAREHKHRNKPFPDRIYRGRILKLVRERGQVSGLRLGQMIDPDFDKHLDQEWLEAMVNRLVADGLLARRGTKITLPE